MSKQPPPAPTASAVGPCPTLIKIVGRPGTENLPSTFAPPDHPLQHTALGLKISGCTKTDKEQNMSSWATFSPSGEISNQFYHNINLTIRQRFLPPK